MKTSTDFIVLDGLPRQNVANALQVQARSDYTDASQRIITAFANASQKVHVAGSKITEFRDAIASARLEVNHACNVFLAEAAAAEQLFQAGIDLIADEPRGQADGVTNG